MGGMLDLATEYAVLPLLNERWTQIHRAAKPRWRTIIPPPTPADDHATIVVQRGNNKNYRLTVRSVFKAYSEGALICSRKRYPAPISKNLKNIREDQTHQNSLRSGNKRKNEYTLLLAKWKSLWANLGQSAT